MREAVNSIGQAHRPTDGNPRGDTLPVLTVARLHCGSPPSLHSFVLLLFYDTMELAVRTD